jgi:hypothetical protein
MISFICGIENAELVEAAETEWLLPRTRSEEK